MNDDTKKFHDEILTLARELGPFLVSKNEAYGDATRVIGRCMAELFPNGIPVSHLSNAYYMIQVLNKLCRVASNDPASDDPMKENPWKDAAGYSILAHAKATASRADAVPFPFREKPHRLAAHQFIRIGPDKCECGEERDADCHPSRPFIGFHKFEPQESAGSRYCNQPDCEKSEDALIHTRTQFPGPVEKHHFIWAALDTCKCGDSRNAASHFINGMSAHPFEASRVTWEGRPICGFGGVCWQLDEHEIHIQKRSC